MRKKMMWFLYFSIVIITASLHATDIGIRIPDSTAVVGNIIDIPVYVDSSLTGESVYSYQLQISFSSNYLNANSVVIAGTMSDLFSVSFNNSVSGQVLIAGAGTIPLNGTGVLLYIQFETLQTSLTSISFTDQEHNFFNEGNPAMILDNGSINISDPPLITINPNVALLTVGDSLQFSVSGGTAPYQYSLTNEAVATIDTSGLFFAVGAGSTSVIAEDEEGIVDTTDSIIEVRSLKLSIPDTTVIQGQTFNLPLYTTVLTDLGISSGNITLSYDHNRLEALNVITTGTILSGYSTPIFNIGSGQIEIVFAGSNTLSGQGILLYIQMSASIQNYGGINIEFSDVLFNEDILAATQNGYCYINQLPPLNVAPNTADLIAGDSLQFSASGGTPPYEWSSSDSTVAYINNSGMLFAVRSGVIIVSITDSLGGYGESSNIQIYDIQVTIPDSLGPVGLTFDLPIHIDELPEDQSVFSIEATISYEIPELQAIEVVTEGTLTEGWSFVQDNIGNQITLAGAGANSFYNAGPILKIKFQLTEALSIGQNAWVNIDEILLNEGIPLPLTENGSIIGRQAQPDISVSPDSLFQILVQGETDSLTMSISNTGIDDLTFNTTNTTVISDTNYYSVQNSPLSSSYNNNTYDELGWTDVSVSESGEITDWEISYTWDTDSWPYEGSFWVESPSGTQVQIASGDNDGTYNVHLSDFIGESMNGIWKLWIYDSYGDGGHQSTNITMTIFTLNSDETWLSINPSSGVVDHEGFQDITVIFDR